MKNIITARVSDLSVDELRFLIQETVRQTFEDLFRDPDIGVELRPDFKAEDKEELCQIC